MSFHAYFSTESRLKSMCMIITKSLHTGLLWPLIDPINGQNNTLIKIQKYKPSGGFGKLSLSLLR